MNDRHIAYIGIGSNLDTPKQQVVSACTYLAQHPALTLTKQSHWYQSTAIGPKGQPDYINGAALVETTLCAEDLLTVMQEIEDTHQRVREQRWGARTLDLDLLLYDDHTISSERLSVPHPEIDRRNFVLKPLLDINPQLSLPDGRLIADILNIIGTQDLKDLGKS